MSRIRSIARTGSVLSNHIGTSTTTAPVRCFSHLSQAGPSRLPSHALRPTLVLPKRLNSTSPPSGFLGRRKGVKPVHLFLGLVGVGLFVTIYTTLEYLYALDTWPEPVRTPLKKAIKAKNQGDTTRADMYFNEAIEAALSVPPSALAPDPLAKLSGLYIAYSHFLETQTSNKVKAYAQLQTALEQFGPAPLSPNPQDRIAGTWSGNVLMSENDHVRAIGITQKLGQLALEISTGATAHIYPASEDRSAPKSYFDAAEKYLSEALNAMLRLGLNVNGPQPPGSISGEDKAIRGSAGHGRVIVGKDVVLPEASVGEEDDGGGRVDIRGLGVTMEWLAEVYATKGEPAIAGQLLIQAISTLLPPQSTEQPPAKDRCQAALLMSTVSSHAIHPMTASAIKASKSWSLRSLQIADQVLKETGRTSADNNIAIALCQKSTCAARFNMGMIAEIEKDTDTALKHFNSALVLAREIGYTEGKRQATDAIRRIRQATKA